MQKIRLIFVSGIFLYLLIFTIQNRMNISLVIPFYKTFHNVPFFIVILASIGIGMTIQFFSSIFKIRKKSK